MMRAIPFYSSTLFHVMQVSNHTKDDCPLTIISCPYAGMGCTAKVRNSYNSPRETHHAPYNRMQVSSIEGCFDRRSFRSTKVDSIEDKSQFDRRL